MLLGKDDITNDVITLGPCFPVFVYICADWRKSDNSVDGEPQGNWWWSIKFQRCSCNLSFLFLPCRQSAWRAWSQVRHIQVQLYWHASC